MFYSIIWNTVCDDWYSAPPPVLPAMYALRRHYYYGNLEYVEICTVCMMRANAYCM